jgi:hypothetical protein
MDEQLETKAGYDAVNKYEKMRMIGTEDSQSVSFPIDIKHTQVIAFAKAMDDVLTKNDSKGGWSDCELRYLQARLIEELGEYFALVAKGSLCAVARGEHKKELIDVANFVLMLWDRS